MRRFLSTTALLLVLALFASACGTQLTINTESGVAIGDLDGGTELPEPFPTDGPRQDSPTTTPEPTTPTPAPTPTPRPQLTLDDALDTYFDSVEAFWSTTLPNTHGLDFEPVQDKFPYRPSDSQTIPNCGGSILPPELYAGNAFYCPLDDFIAWDNEGLFPDLLEEFGDFTVGLVAAHEYGHAIQERTRERGPTIFLELQADCYAGAWAGTANGEEFAFTADDLNGAIGGFLLFRDPLGTVASDSGAHGSAFDRVSAFVEGFRQGPEPCVDYLENPPDVATILLDEFDENEGNLPLDDLIPLLTADLEPYLQSLGRDLVDTTFNAPVEAIDFTADAVVDRCGSFDVIPEDVRGVAFFCTETQQIMYDRSEMERLFETPGAGDFAAAYSLAHAYAESVVRAAGVSDTRAQVLTADCVVGLWARDIWDEQNSVIATEDRVHQLSLSAGDLDEGIVGLVLVPATVPDLANEVQIQAFDRVASFANGFFDGVRECGL